MIRASSKYLFLVMLLAPFGSMSARAQGTTNDDAKKTTLIRCVLTTITPSRDVVQTTGTITDRSFNSRGTETLGLEPIVFGRALDPTAMIYVIDSGDRRVALLQIRVDGKVIQGQGFTLSENPDYPFELSATANGYSADLSCFGTKTWP
jgi:hypothetical protein